MLAGVVVTAAAGCGSAPIEFRGAAVTVAPPPSVPPVTARPVTTPPVVGAPAVTTSLSPLAAAIVPAGSTLYENRPAVVLPRPTSLAVEGIGVRDAPVIGVGVDPTGAFAVPPVDEVGWYRYGPRPGDPGSAVLAAHIAFDGVDGVFRRLASVRDGAVVTVAFEDGVTRRFAVTGVERIDKDELPAALFATTGPSQLVLITCGGAFNRDRRSYEDNIVVIARPI